MNTTENHGSAIQYSFSADSNPGACSLKQHPVPVVWNELRNAGRFTRLTAFPEDWNSYRKILREKLRNLMGLDYQPDLPLDYSVIREFEHDGCRIRNIIYQTRPGVYTTATLYLPQGNGPFPAVINLHGHWKEGRLAERVQSRGFVLAKNGFAVLSPDTFGAGERSTVHTEYEYHGGVLGAALFNLGETLMGCQLADNMRGVDLLCSLPEIDSEKIGATGASGGGNQTMWLTAMDDRIKASVPVCSVGSFDSYIGESNCVCETLPCGLELTEMAALLALAAPRAMMICTGLYDAKTFSPQEMLRSFDAAKPVFEQFGAVDNFACRILNQGHAYSKEAREIMLGRFELHLKGIGHGMPKQEPSFSAMEQKDLLTFEPGKRPAKVVSIAEYCKRRGAGLREKLLARTGFDRGAECSGLADILKINPMPSVQFATELRPVDGWRRFQLELSCGRTLPLVVFPGHGEVVLMTHVSGKKAIPEAVIETEMSKGNTVVLADLSGHGENQPAPDRVSVYHQYSRSLLWLGQTLTGEWVRELGAIAGFLKEKFPDQILVLHGFRETALASLYTSIFTQNIRKVILEDAPVSYVFCERTDFYTMAMPVPGILKWGDIPLAAALSGAELEWINPRDSAGNPAMPPDTQFFTTKLTRTNQSQY